MQRKSTIAAVVASLALLTGTSIAATPAKAAAFPFSYEIFYGPNCYSGRTAFRHYEGYNAGEAWINDTFNGDLNGGSPGYGQKIRNNAASIYVKNANVGIFIDGQSRATSSYQAGAGRCFNFSPGVRNHNTGWRTYYYGG